MKLVIEVSEKIYDTIMADVMPTREQMSVIVTRIYQGIPYEERPHGEWIYHAEWELDGECAYECSRCGIGADVDYNFCPKCGADMREGEAEC